MARHRRDGWAFSRARHRGPGSIERTVRRGRNALTVSIAATALVAMIFWSTPAFDSRA
ncbi:hypothetical protein [Diaminobutyricimonas aerilata]|uniref:hypothetical protein n=1 Tax=Diaminobutyricimonas aerilata TaxID=1162967 RepID=UPI0012FDAF77|nr:hypothetical protein [Diaminobutyricimonas aerilata]